MIQVSGKQLVIEEKPDVKKAGGVFYTPSYIVEYIVKHTVDKLLDGKTPKQVEKIRIVDPACGSGSFLIVAYQHLLDWHLDYYLRNGGQDKFKKEIHRTQGGGWRLSTQMRKAILTNNIFGVDIDAQAVEVTKLSLLLKVLEGDSVGQTMDLFKGERLLPDLGNNIKCGNSLVGSDFYAQENIPEFSHDERLRLNLFEWSFAFPEVFKVGGFDIVLGNPPYLGGREWSKDNRTTFAYFISEYETLEYQFDMYAVFMEKALRILKKGGVLSFITPNTWLNNQSNLKLRQFVLNKTHIQRVLDCSQKKVFEDATVLTVVFMLAKGKSKEPTQIDFLPPDEEATIERHRLLQSVWLEHEAAVINTNLSSSDGGLLAKIEVDTQALEDLAKVKRGVMLYETGKGTPPQDASFASKKVYESTQQVDQSWRQYLEGKDINPYLIDYKGRWVKYGKNLAAPRSADLFEGERLLCRRITGKTLICAYTDHDYVTSQLMHIIKPNKPELAKFLLGVLSSKLIYFYFSKKYNRTNDKAFPEIRIYELSAMPIKLNPPLQTKITTLVDRLLALQGKDAQQAMGLKIGIDKLVYELYGLTPDEVVMVEV